MLQVKVSILSDPGIPNAHAYTRTHTYTHLAKFFPENVRSPKNPLPMRGKPFWGRKVSEAKGF
jgi:hypothetical protein